MKKFFLFFLLVLLTASCNKIEKKKNVIDQKMVMHTMGEIDGYTYTNSLEAFLDNYNKGARFFEVDFDFLDGHLICCHDYKVWKTFVPEGLEYNYENFKNTTLTKNEYHTLDIDDLSELLDEYDDIYIITDTKYRDEETVTNQFKEIYNKCKGNIDRIIPQIYTKEMHKFVTKIYSFSSMIFTLYFLKNWDASDIAEFMNKNNIPIVTMWDYLCTKEVCNIFKEKDITICAHTVNDINKANELFENGCDIVYSDSIIYID